MKCFHPCCDSIWLTSWFSSLNWFNSQNCCVFSWLIEPHSSSFVHSIMHCNSDKPSKQNTKSILCICVEEVIAYASTIFNVGNEGESLSKESINLSFYVFPAKAKILKLLPFFPQRRKHDRTELTLQMRKKLLKFPYFVNRVACLKHFLIVWVANRKARLSWKILTF